MPSIQFFFYFMYPHLNMKQVNKEFKILLTAQNEMDGCFEIVKTFRTGTKMNYYSNMYLESNKKSLLVKYC